MQDLTHPNEYIRGSTLRFMCKLKEPELLESLVESIKGNLTNNNSYVRKNAVLAVYSIYKDFEYLIPDAPQIIYNFLLSVCHNKERGEEKETKEKRKKQMKRERRREDRDRG